MRVLDKTGLTTLWSKIKALVSKCLPLTGGTITGNLTLNGTVNTSGININSNNSKYAFDIDKAIELGLLVKNDSLIL